MIYSADDSVVDARNRGGNKRLFTDIHCHCLPGLDDGPRTMDEAIALCRRLVAEGIATAVATPHQLGRYDGRNEATKIRDVTYRLSVQLQRDGIELTVLPGGDVRVDERLCRLLEEDRVLTIADTGKYILLEMPHQIFIDLETLIAGLAALNVKAVISHPERHVTLLRQPRVILRWLEIGAYFQVDAGSLLGDGGPEVQRAAWRFLSSGWALLVATDAHNTSDREPCMVKAFNRICTRLGEDLACIVCIENPARVINGRKIVRCSSPVTRDQ